MKEHRVMVVGGGIGGLSAGLALQRSGVPVTVFEHSPELGEVGTGVQVWVNGTAALDQLGVGDAVQTLGSPIEEHELRSWRDRLLAYLPLGDLARKYDSPPPVIIRRPDLLRSLAEALAGDTVQLGAEVVGCEQDGDGVTARFADGREERGAALVGADGIHSVTRRGFAPEVEPRYAGYQYLRALTRHDETLLPASKVEMTFGPGDRFGMSDAGGGSLYWWAVIAVPQGTEDPAAGRKGDLLQRFARFPERIPAVIESTSDESILRNDIFDLKPMDRWDHGRVTLLGDAAHATTPNLGRGASEAIEDGVTIADCLRSIDLADGAALTAALRTYEDRRMGPTAKVQANAWRIGKLANWSDPLRTRVREVMMSRVAAKGMAKEAETDFMRAGASAQGR